MTTEALSFRIIVAFAPKPMFNGEFPTFNRAVLDIVNVVVLPALSLRRTLSATLVMLLPLRLMNGFTL